MSCENDAKLNLASLNSSEINITSVVLQNSKHYVLPLIYNIIDSVITVLVIANLLITNSLITIIFYGVL